MSSCRAPPTKCISGCVILPRICIRPSYLWFKKTSEEREMQAAAIAGRKSRVSGGILPIVCLGGTLE